jgi:signal transduction histidine kinase
MIHMVELVFYFAFLVIIGFLAERLAHTLNMQERAMRILDLKHKISLELMICDAWPTLMTQLTKIPGMIAEVDETNLYLYNPVTARLERQAHWREGSQPGDAIFTEFDCQGCQAAVAASDYRLSRCRPLPGQETSEGQAARYCWPIQYRDSQIGLLQMSLKQGQDLSEEQKEIFENIDDELAIVLKSSLDRKSLADYQIAETSLAERRKVSHFLHDSLSQNLAFLRLKLDQAVRNLDKTPTEMLQHDLTQMLSAASEAYETVRGTIEHMNPETRPLLTNLLQEHARSVARRANFEVNFETHGKPLAMLPDVQQEIFNVFREVLNNISAYARASRVDIVAEWCESDLQLTISDNGIGFNPQAVDPSKHFGIAIMKERIARVSGQIHLTSSENSGTTVSITVPAALGRTVQRQG